MKKHYNSMWNCGCDAALPKNRINKLLTVILTLMLTLNLGLIFSSKAYAADNTKLKTVRVAVEDSEIFFKTNDDNEIVSGYAFDYIQSIAAYANWKVEYILGTSFENCLDMVKNGKADLYYDVSYTEERAEWLIYSETPMGTEEYYLFCLADNDELYAEDFSSFEGKTAGVTAGTIEEKELEDWCENKGIHMDIVEFSSDSEKEKALEAGEIDMEYEISMLAKNNFSALALVSSSDYYLVANKYRGDLITDANLAYEKLIDVNRYFLEHLNEKYFAKSVINRTLSVEETLWVKNHNVMRIGYLDNYLPFSDQTEGKSETGIIKDITPAILSSIGLNDELEIEYYGYTTTDEMFTALKNDEIDVIFPVHDNLDFAVKKGVLISLDVLSLSADLVYKGDYKEDTTDAIAINRGNELQVYYVMENYPEAEIVYCDTIKDCLEAVKNGAAGATILNGLRTSVLLSGDYAGLSSLRLTQSFGYCFAVNEGNSALLSIFNRAIVSMEDGFAYNYAIYYLGNDGPANMREYFQAHKVMILTIIIVFLLIISFAAGMTAYSAARTKRKLAEANDAKTKFLFNMSHDIRTPMNAIIGFTDVAVDNQNDKEKLNESLQNIKEASDLLLSMINGILEMSRIESGIIELDEIAGDVRMSFDTVKNTLTELAEKKNISLEFEFGNIKDNFVYADINCANRIFINIISNSIKYTQNGGWVKVKCEQTGRREDTGIYTYTFEDNGIGMSEEFQKHLFEMFAREKNTTATGIQGFGLGLSVVKSFVDIMEGTINLKSEQGKGTLFTVTFPFKLQKDGGKELFYNYEKGRQEFANSEREEEKQMHFEGKKALLVEDNELNRVLAKYILSKEGIEVDEAEDGSVAVERIKEKGPDYYDIIFMDIQMPVLNGLEATKTIRKMYPDSKLPIVAISANAFSEDKEASIRAGMNDHIAKPINNDELFRVMTKYI